MTKDAFSRLEKEDIEIALAAINPLIDGSDYSTDHVTILSWPLSFYPTYRLLDIADYEAVPVRRNFAIYKPGHAVVLDTTNAPLYRLNKDIPVQLGKDNVTDYIKFFFANTQGRSGRFQIVETVEDISWVEDPPPAVRKAIGEMVEPVSLLEASKTDGFRLRACTIYRKALFAVDIVVAPDGTVSLEKETLLIDDLPVVDDILDQ